MQHPLEENVSRLAVNLEAQDLHILICLFRQFVHAFHVQLHCLCIWEDVDDTQFRALLVVVRDMGNSTGFVCLCLFSDLSVILLISFELALLDFLIADEDDRLRHFGFLSQRVTTIHLKNKFPSLRGGRIPTKQSLTLFLQTFCLRLLRRQTTAAHNDSAGFRYSLTSDSISCLMVL